MVSSPPCCIVISGASSLGSFGKDSLEDSLISLDMWSKNISGLYD
jgi:hypothetical protein